MMMKDLSSEAIERIGVFLRTQDEHNAVYTNPPVNGIQGMFNQTLALRDSDVTRTSFATPAGMIHEDDLVSGKALFYALSRGAPVHHILDIIARCPQALSTRDMKDNSVLHAAILGKYCVGVLRLVCGAPEDWRVKKMAVNRTKMTPLHTALEENAEHEVIEFLLDGGRDMLSMKNTNGDLPLHCAVRNVAALRVIALLIDTGDGHVLMSQNQQGNLPLHLAGEFGVSERQVIPLLSRPEIHSEVRLTRNEDSHTPLYLAVSSRQDIRVLELLIDCDKKVLTRGMIPLHLALSKRVSFEVTKLLIDADKTVLTIPRLGYYPFHMAIQHRASTEILELLLDDGGACLRLYPRDGKGPLHIACETGSTFDVIKFLVDRDKTDLIRQSDWNTHEQTPLHLALFKKHVHPMSLESIAYLVEGDRNALKMVNLKNEMPLHVALVNRLDVGIIEFLAKADRYPLTKKAGRDCTPLRLAVSIRGGCFSMEYRSVIPLLIDDNECVLFDQSPTYQHLPLLHFALKYRRTDSAPEDLKLFIDSDKRILLCADSETRYPLHVALERCQSTETLNLLMDDERTILTRIPVRMNKQVHQGFTPLHHFLQYSNVYDAETIMLLTDASETVLTTPDRDGEVPLHYAIRHGSKFPDIIPLLIDTDKKCLRQCGSRGCPLQLAIVFRWSVEMLRILVDPLGKVFRLRGEMENTPLHTSVCLKSDDATVRFLVDSDPYVLRTQNSHDYTPLHAAIDNKMCGLSDYCDHTDTKRHHEWNLDMLFLLGANDERVLRVPNVYGQTPLFSAIVRGFPVHVLQYLIDWEGSVLSLPTERRAGQLTPLQKCIIGNNRAIAEDTIRLLVEHVGGQDALIIPDLHGDTPLHNAILHQLPPQIIRFLAYKSMPPVCFGQNGRVIPTLTCEHALGMLNKSGMTPLHTAMNCLELTSEYDELLYLVQIYPRALGIVCNSQKTPLTMSLHLVLENVMPVSVLERLVQSYPHALVVNDPREGFCKFPLVYTLKKLKTVCALDVETLIQVLGLLIDGDRVVMRRHGGGMTPYELAVRENRCPRVQQFLLDHT